MKVFIGFAKIAFALCVLQLCHVLFMEVMSWCVSETNKKKKALKIACKLIENYFLTNTCKPMKTLEIPFG